MAIGDPPRARTDRVLELTLQPSGFMLIPGVRALASAVRRLFAMISIAPRITTWVTSAVSASNYSYRPHRLLWVVNCRNWIHRLFGARGGDSYQRRAVCLEWPRSIRRDSPGMESGKPKVTTL